MNLIFVCCFGGKSVSYRRTGNHCSNSPRWFRVIERRKSIPTLITGWSSLSVPHPTRGPTWAALAVLSNTLGVELKPAKHPWVDERTATRNQTQRESVCEVGGYWEVDRAMSSPTPNRRLAGAPRFRFQGSTKPWRGAQDFGEVRRSGWWTRGVLHRQSPRSDLSSGGPTAVGGARRSGRRGAFRVATGRGRGWEGAGGWAPGFWVCRYRVGLWPGIWMSAGRPPSPADTRPAFPALKAEGRRPDRHSPLTLG